MSDTNDLVQRLEETEAMLAVARRQCARFEAALMRIRRVTFQDPAVQALQCVNEALYASEAKADAHSLASMSSARESKASRAKSDHE